jgi:nicotinate-nucleotide pyrophosphorylase
MAAYEQFPEARQALDEVYDILKSFTPEQIKRLNESNEINRVIPDVMTDRTGQLLLEAIRELKETTIRYDE